MRMNSIEPSYDLVEGVSIINKLLRQCLHENEPALQFAKLILCDPYIRESHLYEFYRKNQRYTPIYFERAMHILADYDYFDINPIKCEPQTHERRPYIEKYDLTDCYSLSIILYTYISSIFPDFQKLNSVLGMFQYKKEDLLRAVIACYRHCKAESFTYYKWRAFVHLQLIKLTNDSIVDELNRECLRIGLPKMNTDRPQHIFSIEKISENPKLLFDKYDELASWIMADDSYDCQSLCDALSLAVDTHATRSTVGVITGSDYACLVLARFCLDANVEPIQKKCARSWIRYIIKWRSLDEIRPKDEGNNWLAWLISATDLINNWLSKESTNEDAKKIIQSASRVSSAAMMLNYVAAASKLKHTMNDPIKITRLEQIIKQLRSSMSNKQIRDNDLINDEPFNQRLEFASKIIMSHNLTKVDLVNSSTIYSKSIHEIASMCSISDDHHVPFSFELFPHVLLLGEEDFKKLFCSILPRLCEKRSHTLNCRTLALNISFIMAKPEYAFDVFCARFLSDCKSNKNHVNITCQPSNENIFACIRASIMLSANSYRDTIYMTFKSVCERVQTRIATKVTLDSRTASLINFMMEISLQMIILEENQSSSCIFKLNKNITKMVKNSKIAFKHCEKIDWLSAHTNSEKNTSIDDNNNNNNKIMPSFQIVSNKFQSRA